MRGIAVFLTCIIGAFGLYDGNSDVADLTASNFQSKVIDSDSVWIVEFFAPWCGHCKSLVPEYTKAAKVLKGIVKVGAVDMTQHQSVGAPYDVRGFPTIKVFGADKHKPTDYQGPRTAQGLTDAGMNELKKLVSARMSGKTGGGGGGGQKKQPPKGDQKDVIELTDSDLEDEITGSEEMWLVEFFAPWCGHCKNLAPHWAAAATELKGKVKVAAVDATVHTVVANKFGIRGFPTIKWFPAGKKSLEDAQDYDGGRTGGDIVQWALNKLAENIPPPEIKQLTSADVLKGACENHQLCIVSVLPQLLDCQSACRNDYIRIMRDLGEKFRKNVWGWVWTEAGSQPELEDALGIGGFGYPAMAAVNSRKAKFSILRGSFSYDGINEFLRDLSYGKGSTSPLKGAELPKINKEEKWDGKDAQMPQEEEIDLSDVELDDLNEKVEL